jgi:hypothetical protein
VAVFVHVVFSNVWVGGGLSGPPVITEEKTFQAFHVVTRHSGKGGASPGAVAV